MHLVYSESYQSSKVIWLTYKINKKKKHWTPACLWVWPWQNKLQGTFYFCVWVYVCLTPKSHPKVSLFSPRAAWCNKILICPWLTLVLFGAEMHRECLVYPQYPWQMASLLCLWSGMGVAVHVCVCVCDDDAGAKLVSHHSVDCAFNSSVHTLMSTSSVLYLPPPKVAALLPKISH